MNVRSTARTATVERVQPRVASTSGYQFFPITQITL
jgi:hypothetical protein